MQKCRDLFREGDGTLVYAYACLCLRNSFVAAHGHPKQSKTRSTVRSYESTCYDVMTTEFDSKFYKTNYARFRNTRKYIHSHTKFQIPINATVPLSGKKRINLFQMQVRSVLMPGKLLVLSEYIYNTIPLLKRSRASSSWDS